jgi:basic membrane protein A
MVLVLVVVACKSEATEAPDVEQKTRVAAVFPGVVSDQSWNQFGYEGLTRAEKDCDLEIAYTEDVFPDEQVEVFRNYAAEGYDVIIGHGGKYADSIAQVAAEYPDIWFGDTNGLPEGDNVSLKLSRQLYLLSEHVRRITIIEWGPPSKYDKTLDRTFVIVL